MFRSIAASVKLADVTSARSSSTIRHFAWRHALGPDEGDSARWSYSTRGYLRPDHCVRLKSSANSLTISESARLSFHACWMFVKIRTSSVGLLSMLLASEANTRSPCRMANPATTPDRFAEANSSGTTTPVSLLEDCAGSGPDQTSSRG